MKAPILVLFILFSPLLVIAQQTNYQSKVYINGKPASGQHLIQFRIPAMSWVSAQKTVSIETGLFSTVIDFPSTLFDDTNSWREMIVNLDGNDIDTVTIFAPIERDPTVKKYIRDSINWNDIHHKPNIDTVPQTLSLKGDSLNISNGNTVKLPGVSSGGSLTVNGEFKVIDTAIHQSFSLLGFSYNSKTGTPDKSYWQSFQATETGKLRQISLPVAASCNNYITVYIYAGIGTSTQYLGYKSCPVTSSISIQTLDLTSGVNSSANGYITLENSKMYTFLISPPSGCAVSVGYADTDSYTNGISNIGVTSDILFAIGMDRTAPPNFIIAPNGYVGIGVDPPTTQLEVGGRIKDQTGWVMPVGSILAYGGSAIPDGWLLCDGRVLKRDNYPDLFNAIGTAWGSNDRTDFILPDTRGIFLRGVDNSPETGVSGNDPDVSSRTTSANNGNSGNNVGSKQSDLLRSHNHNITANQRGAGAGSSGVVAHSGGGSSGSPTAMSIGNSGGSETRPVNVYVNYIIKY